MQFALDIFLNIRYKYFMDKIENIFEKTFSNWNIKFPENNENGYIANKGWLIQYCFGEENGRKYFDYYATHRMTGDDHNRIYEDGQTDELPVYWSSYLTDTPEPEPIRSERLKKYEKEAFEEHNKSVTEMLINKGFTKFTINMIINAGFDK